MSSGALERLSQVAFVEPGSGEELAKRLGDAAGSGAKILPCGGGCFLDLGGPIRSPDIVLRTVNLSRLVFYEPEELVVKAEAGTTLSAISRQLAAKGQELPWDYPWPESQTLGGVVSSGVSGPRRLGFGSVRDHVLGLTVALPDGGLIKTGGRVMKNAAGYSLTRLFNGARGTLGIITEVTLRIKPLAESFWSVTVEFAEPGIHTSLIRTVSSGDYFPSFMELRGALGGYRLSIGFEGMREEVEAQRSRLMREVPPGVRTVERRDGECREHLAVLASEPWSKQGPVFRASVPRSKLAALIDASDMQVCASAGNGVVRFLLSHDASEIEAREILGRLSARARGLGGWAVQERGPLAPAEDLPMAVLKLNSGIRAIFDPGKRLSGGRSAYGF